MAGLNDLLTGPDRQAVADAIREAESGTAGEIVVVVAAASGRYGHGAALLALLVSLVAAGTFGRLWPLPIAFLLALAAAERFPALKVAFTTRSEQEDEVRRAAAASYQRFKVGRTVGSTGILIYVSLAERMARVLGDGAINNKVEEKAWQALCRLVTLSMAAGRPKEALLDAVRSAGELLKRHFPLKIGDTNELNNDLILLEELP